MPSNREITEALVEFYSTNKDKKALEAKAQELGVNYRSAVSRLTRAGVYEKLVYLAKDGLPPRTKEMLVEELAELHGVEPWRLEGLEKAPKQVIQFLINLELGQVK